MRALIGVFLVVHALAHAGAGVWASGNSTPVWLVTIAWWVATVGFLFAGLGVLGHRRIQRHWRVWMYLGATSSTLLLVFFAHRAFAPGLAINFVIIVCTRRVQHRSVVTNHDSNHRWRRTTSNALLGALVLYLSAAILLRPWHTNWGTSAGERALPLPGDETTPASQYRMDHAITIAAPADSVWPWLVQIGQDRGGFYSYAWLERLIGDDITNADRIHPEWQQLRAGDLVRATQPDYLGGIFGRDLGWRVARIDEGRAIVLANWGAFVIRPIDDSTSRLHIRLRGAGTPGTTATIFGPLNLLFFEPPHFIMERGMLRGIKQRAERG